MDMIRRKLTLDICDYAGNRLCPIYDSFSDVMGQAYDVVVTAQRNGSKTLTFNVPMTCQTQNGQQENFRIDYIKADYKILFEDQKGKDWYLLTSPKFSHNGVKKSINIMANHTSQLLKFKALNLEFSDEEGNNVGTIDELVSTVLQGTGWSLRRCANFYQDDTYDLQEESNDNKKIKIRSIKASSKTGAFKLISTICQKFNAKPVYNGWDKTVDILPLNPFKLEQDEQAPNVTYTDGVIEIHYGNNMKTIQRQMNTDNIATRLYVYGAYGQDTLGYLDISRCNHIEYTMYNQRTLKQGQTYYFTLQDKDGIPTSFHFTPKKDIPANHELIFSFMDPASMMYLWDQTGNCAIPVTRGKAGNPLPSGNKLSPEDIFQLGSGKLGTNKLREEV